MTETKQKIKSEDLIITRSFDAPRELVWKAWTEPERIMRWWGPKNYTAPVAKVDLSVGGKYLFCMRSPEGKDIWSTGVFREIAAPERLVWTDSFADADGNVVSGSHYGMGDDFPLELLVTVILQEQGGKTHMTLTHAGLPAGGVKKDTGVGWNESFDKMAAFLENKKESA